MFTEAAASRQHSGRVINTGTSMHQILHTYFIRVNAPK